MLITIDGPAGSGKSAVALQLAIRLGYRHLDTGAMYRAVVLDALERQLAADPQAVAQRVRELRLEFDWLTRPARVLLDGRDVSHAIRSPHVTAALAVSADNVAVREELVLRQRRIGEDSGHLVTEGRDQGTVVFPAAPYKFYLDADPLERARRRVHQLARQGVSADVEVTLLQIQERDTRDAARRVGPLARPKDARLIDTTRLGLDQVVELLAQIVQPVEGAGVSAAGTRAAP